MKGRIGTASTIKYARPYLAPRLYRLAVYETLSDKAKIRFKAIDLYSSGKYTIGQISEIFEIDRSTFYRWRKSYNPKSLKSLEDKSKKPKRVRQKVVRNYEAEHAVCEIRRKYPYFGKEKIQRILKRDHGLDISVSSVGRILTQYRSILPRLKVVRKRVKTRKRDRIRLNQVKRDMQGKISEWLQADTIELNLKWIKAYIFTAVDPVSKLLFIRAYRKLNSLNGKDFLARLNYLYDKDLCYIQVDNGSEFAKHFEVGAKEIGITLITNYPKSPKMNCYVEKANDTIQNEYLDRFYEETTLKGINKILYDCLIEYNFYRPHRSLNLLAPIEFCEQRILEGQNLEMLHMYRTQSRS